MIAALLLEDFRTIRDKQQIPLGEMSDTKKIRLTTTGHTIFSGVTSSLTMMVRKERPKRELGVSIRHLIFLV